MANWSKPAGCSPLWPADSWPDHGPGADRPRRRGGAVDLIDGQQKKRHGQTRDSSFVSRAADQLIRIMQL
jgi:hypothetical protein